ncbi:MAG: BON domain-containing protein [Desulfovibrio sp.]|jgi:osmotically-inducible protein OsmY|nr:BON domain-containing protein [Desulfovibrio sp.]
MRCKGERAVSSPGFLTGPDWPCYAFSIIPPFPPEDFAMRVLVLSLLFLFPAAGCAFLSGPPGGEKTSFDYQYDDAGVKTAVASALLAENPSKANDVEVHSFRGHVFLVGEADADFRRFALDAAGRAAGVVSVTAHWFPAGSMDTSNDVLLEAALEERLRPLAETPGSRVDVDVWGGHAVLTGILPDAEHLARAEATARATPGIRDVTSYLAAE